jgi:NADH dehydrogenase FAD-containing subunit
VDQQLRALPEVFVAGDTAAAAFDAEHTVMQACQHATPLGKVAGYNAAADLLDVPLRDFPLARTSPAWTWAAPVQSSPGAGTAG